MCARSLRKQFCSPSFCAILHHLHLSPIREAGACSDTGGTQSRLVAAAPAHPRNGSRRAAAPFPLRPRTATCWREPGNGDTARRRMRGRRPALPRAFCVRKPAPAAWRPVSRRLPDGRACIRVVDSRTSCHQERPAPEKRRTYKNDRACTPTFARAHALAGSLARTHARAHARSFAHASARAHTHAHARWWRSSLPSTGRRAGWIARPASAAVTPGNAVLPNEHKTRKRRAILYYEGEGDGEAERNRERHALVFLTSQ